MYQIRFTLTAVNLLREISDKRIQKKLIEAVEDLQAEPEKKGKALAAELEGYCSTRAVGQRYRIVYRIDDELTTVFIVALGIRKAGANDDIYEIAKKLIRQGLLEA